MDIKKVDLSKLILNNQDVALKGIVELAKKSSIVIPDDVSEETRKQLEKMDKLISLEVVAKGSEVAFEQGQLVSMKSDRLPAYDELNEDGSERLFVVSMTNIAYAINKEDYEL